MAKRRDLKKNVNYIADIMASFCMIEVMNADSAKHDSLNKLVAEVASLRSDIISRISHTEPGNVKGFYKKLKSDFNSGLEEIFNKLNDK